MVKKKVAYKQQRRYWQNWLLTGVLFITLAMMAGLVTQTAHRHHKLASLIQLWHGERETTSSAMARKGGSGVVGGKFLDLDYDEDWFDDDWYDNDWYDDDWYEHAGRTMLDASQIRQAQLINQRQAELMLAALGFIAGMVIAYWLMSDFCRLSLEQTISGSKRVWCLLLLAVVATVILYWLCLAMIV